MSAEKPQIYSLMPKAAEAIGHIGKGQFNPHGKYKFRGIDDVYNAIGPALAKHGITMTHAIDWHSVTDRKTSKGTPMVHALIQQTTTWTAPDGSSVSTQTIGEAMDSGDKAFNKAMSAATKYALFRTFAIPTEEQEDADASSPKIGSSNGTKPPPQNGKPSPLSELVAELEDAADAESVKSIGVKINALPKSSAQQAAYRKARKKFDELRAEAA